MSFDGIVLTLLAVLAGLFVGFARRGRLLAVAATPVRAKSLLVIGVVVPALSERFTREVAVPLVVAGLAALFAFAIVNVRIVGMSVVAIGVLANLLATFLNGGLPVSRDALVEAGLATRDEVDRVELRGARRLDEPTHRLRFLGDVVPLRETGQVLSFGDLVVLVGLADITANLTLRRRARRRTGAAADDPAENAAAYFDDDEFSLPDVEEWLFATTTFTASPDGERADPRPSPRSRPQRRREREIAAEAEERLAMVLEHGPPADASLEIVDQAADEIDLGLVAPPRPSAAREPDVVWWDPSPAVETVTATAAEPPAFDLRRDPDHDERPLAPVAADEPAVIHQPVIVDAPASDVPTLDVATFDIPTLDVAALDLPVLEAEAVADDADAGVAAATVDPVAITVDADAATVEPIGLAEPAAAGPVIDLRDDPDELLRAIFADFAPRRRSRRRGGGRNIPDFEPIHLDDALTSKG